MTTANGLQGSFGYAQSDILGVHKDPTKWIALNEAPTIETEIVQIDSKTFSPGMAHKSIERLQGTFNCSGSFAFDLHPEEGIEFLKAVLGEVTTTELTGIGSGIYTSSFLGGDTVPMPNGFSLTINQDLKVYYIAGAIVTSAEISSEIDGTVICTINWIGKKWTAASAGTSSTETGDSAITFPITFSGDKQFKIDTNSDSSTITEYTIPNGTYSTAAELEAALNTLISEGGTPTYSNDNTDSDGVEKFACYINGDNKLVFYTSAKGSTAFIDYSPGGTDGSADLGFSTPTHADGLDVLATDTYSSVQPFTSVDLTVKQDSSAICVDNVTISIDTGLAAKKCLGHKYMKAVNIEKKREVTISFTKNYTDEAQVDAWYNNSDVEFEVNLRTGTEIITDSGIDYDGNIYLKKCRIQNSPVPKPASGVIKVEATAMSFYYDATYGDILIDVNNTMSSI
jgi:hypothetical protein